MSRSALVLSFVCLFCLSAWAQETQPKKPRAARPDIPGSFMVDLGINRAFNPPPSYDYAFWGSRTMNFYYQYPIHFGRSKFSFNPGAGLSLERWKFKNEATLQQSGEGDTATFELVAANTYFPNTKKSMLITNYVEVPLEFRFDTNPEDIARSFSWAVGGRIGFLYDSFTKIKYSEEGELKKVKNKQNYGLTPFRYGIYTRVGIGAFNFFCFYNLSPLFEDGKGPGKTTMTTLTTGISINGF